MSLAERKDDERCQNEPCLCAKRPVVGARFKRMGRNVLTGLETGWQFYTVVEVMPRTLIFCRRVEMRRDDDGAMCRVQIPDLWLGDWMAVDNITQFSVAHKEN